MIVVTRYLRSITWWRARSRNLRERRPSALVQRLQPSPLDAAPDGERGGANSGINGVGQRGATPLDDDARETAQDDLDPAYLIDASLWAVRVEEADADAFDRRGELPELHPELPGGGVSVPLIEARADDADMSGRRYVECPAARDLGRSWQRVRKHRPLCGGTRRAAAASRPGGTAYGLFSAYATRSGGPPDRRCIGANGGTRGSAPELIQQVGRRHQADELAAINDEQTTNRLPTHQVRCLPQRRGWRGAYGSSRHDVTNRSRLPKLVSISPAEVTFGDEPHNPGAIDDDQVPDPVLPHLGPCGFGRLVWTNRHDSDAHDVFKAHAAFSCKRRARERVATTFNAELAEPAEFPRARGFGHAPERRRLAASART